MPILKKTCTLFAGVSAAVACAGTHAQTTTSDPEQKTNWATVEEVTVTANRREESLSDVPLSIVAMDQAILESKGVKDMDDISRLTPGVILAKGFQNSTSISIRGVSSRYGAPTTGIYIDDIPIQARTTGSGSVTNFYPSVFDLERVEVLRGPQGTLFGAGSVGGTIRFITPKPGLDKYSGYSRAEVGFTDGGDPSYEIGSAIGGPLVKDRVGFRLSGYHRTEGGWIDQIPGGGAREAPHKNANEKNEQALRGALTFQVTDDFTITPAVFYQKRKYDDLDQYFKEFSDPDDGKFIRRGPLREPGDDEFLLYSLNMEYSFDGVRLISGTSYLDRTQKVQADYTGFYTNVLYRDYDRLLPTDNRFVFFNRNEQSGVTQEIRIQSDAPESALQWVLGAFYQDTEMHARVNAVGMPNGIALHQALLGFPPQGPVLPGEVLARTDDTNTDRQLAGFGQIDYKIIPSVTLTFGARYAATRAENHNIFEGALAIPANDRMVQKEEPFTPRFGIKYDATDDVMLYATASKGFRLGGGNASPSVTIRALCPNEIVAIGDRAKSYDSDEIWNYEVGAKGRIGYGLSFEASAYQIDWKNIQNLATLSCGWSFVTNLGDARNRGFDASLSLRPIEGLTLEGSFSYNDAEFTKDGVIQGSTLVRKGDNLIVPPISYTAAADYQFPVSAAVEGYIHLDYQHQDSFSVPRTLAGYTFDQINPHREANDFASARLGARFDGLDIALFVDNLTDSRDVLARVRETPRSSYVKDVTYRPRTYGMTVSYKF